MHGGSAAGAGAVVANGGRSIVFKAIAEERWRDAARELDLAAFDRYRRERVAAARLPSTRPRVTVDEYMQHDSTMPRAVAEYQVRKLNESPINQNSWLSREFADVTDIEALAALSVEDAAARWLQAKDIRWQVRRAADDRRTAGCAPPRESGSSFPAPKYAIFGEIRIDSTTAYVLHKEAEFRKAEPDVDADIHAMPPGIVTLRRIRDRWKILARQGMFHSTFVGYTWSACDAGPRPRR